jgi:hypothetical protein
VQPLAPVMSPWSTFTASVSEREITLRQTPRLHRAPHTTCMKSHVYVCIPVYHMYMYSQEFLLYKNSD